MYTVLVLTGSTTRADLDRYPYRPSRIVESVADLLAELEEEAIGALSDSADWGRLDSAPSQEEPWWWVGVREPS